MAARRDRAARREPAWTRLDDEALLDKRLCDLRLTLAGTWLEDGIRRLYGELGAKGIRFRPHVWLSEEWFSPDGVPGHRDPVLPRAPAPACGSSGASCTRSRAATTSG